MKGRVPRVRGVREVVVTHVVEVDQLVTLRRVVEQGVVLLGEGLADGLVLRVQGHLDSHKQKPEIVNQMGLRNSKERKVREGESSGSLKGWPMTGSNLRVHSKELKRKMMRKSGALKCSCCNNVVLCIQLGMDWKKLKTKFHSKMPDSFAIFYQNFPKYFWHWCFQFTKKQTILFE